MSYKKQFTKWLSALLIASLLLIPVALTEEAPAPADEAVVVSEAEGSPIPSEAEDAPVASEIEDDPVASEIEDAPVAETEDDLDVLQTPNAEFGSLDSLLEDGTFYEADLLEAGEDDEEIEEFCGDGNLTLDNDAMFSAYVKGLFGQPIPALYEARNLGGELTGAKKALYDFLLSCAQDVAAGTLASTVFVFTDTTNTIGSSEFKEVYDRLLMDHPYELYWHLANEWKGSKSYNPTTNQTTLTIRFTVSGSYAAGTYLFDTAKAASAVNAAANARAIVDRYASLSDYDKLEAYLNEICVAVTYSDAAANDDWPDYLEDNPWQVIWVFDGDPTTNVVCEGYAKAFKYLCDMTTFSGKVVCYCVDSDTHMWNIVRMPNGKNYHVDVTDCDDDGHCIDKWMFMKAPTSCDPSVGYVVNKEFYQYSDLTKRIYSAADLTLSPLGYLDDVPVAESTFTLISVPKNTRFTASVGTTYQIDPVGQIGKRFKSSNKKVATVRQNGVIVPRAAGKTKISFKVGKKKHTLTLTVKDSTVPRNIGLSHTGVVAAQVGNVINVGAILPTGTFSAVKWKSSNKKVATVKNGVVVCKKRGTVTITATCTRGRRKARARVKFRIS